VEVRRDAAARIDPHLHVLDLLAAGIGAAREAVPGAEDRILDQMPCHDAPFALT
jgi:hypothetical protein